MNYYMIGFLLVVLPFAFISILQDVKTRKISNVITISFLYISILIFVFFLMLYNVYDYLILIFSFAIGYYFYKKGYWGGADGKIFIALTLLLLALGNEYFYLDFLLNLIIFYSVVMIILVVFRTSFKTKKKLFKKIDYGLILFHLLIIFIFIKSLLMKFVSKDSVYYSYFILFIFIFVLMTANLIKKLYLKFNKEVKIFSLLLLGAIFISFLAFNLIFYFFIVFIFRVLLVFISEMSTHIKTKTDIYQSPFSVYLFFSAIITMIGGNNVINLILNLFF